MNTMKPRRLKRFVTFVGKNLLWSKLRAIGNAPAVRAAIVIPITGYIVLLNQHAVEFSQIDARFQIIADFNPYRLLLIYYGALFTGLGSLVYVLACPGEIRKYDTSVEYVNAELNYHSVSQRAASLMNDTEKTTKAIASAYPEHSNFYIQFMETQEMAGADTDTQYPVQDNYLTELMALNWKAKNRLRKWARVNVAILFAIGFALLFLSSFIMFVEVAIYTVALLV